MEYSYKEEFDINKFFMNYMLSINKPNRNYIYSYTGKNIKLNYDNEYDNEFNNEPIFKDLIGFRNTLIRRLLDSIIHFNYQQNKSISDKLKFFIKDILANNNNRYKDFKIFEIESSFLHNDHNLPQRFLFMIRDFSLVCMYSDFLLNSNSFKVFNGNTMYYNIYKILYIELFDTNYSLLVYDTKDNSYYSIAFLYEISVYKHPCISSIILNILSRYQSMFTRYKLMRQYLAHFKIPDLINEYIIKSDKLCNLEELQNRLTEYNFICKFSDNQLGNEIVLKEIVI